MPTDLHHRRDAERRDVDGTVLAVDGDRMARAADRPIEVVGA